MLGWNTVGRFVGGGSEIVLERGFGGELDYGVWERLVVDDALLF